MSLKLRERRAWEVISYSSAARPLWAKSFFKMQFDVNISREVMLDVSWPTKIITLFSPFQMPIMA